MKNNTRVRYNRDEEFLKFGDTEIEEQKFHFPKVQ